jgi:hypothetical protein
VLDCFSTCYPNPQALSRLSILRGGFVSKLEAGRHLGAVTEKDISGLEEFRRHLLGQELCSRAAFYFRLPSVGREDSKRPLNL